MDTPLPSGPALVHDLLSRRKTLASGSSDKSVRLWNLATRREAVTLHGHTNAVYSVAFGPDGKILASGSQDHTVRLWRAASFAETESADNARSSSR